ncbi:MAG TPA: nitrilase-related carbon-nitrogen hydrolase [Anaerolineales bacterium]|nr:nitrilase-related carbon-nitrogen hydrolase [Anaerolineales bacterium]
MSTMSLAQKKGGITAQTTVVRFVLGIALSALSGWMFLLAFPPYGLWFLAWFGFVPALLAQYRLLPAKWTSLAQTVFAAVWLGPFLARLFGSGYGPFFQYLGIWIAILNFFISKDRRFHELTQYRWFILQGVFAWVGFEMIRATFIPVIATSAFIGYTQATQPWLIQPVSIFSVYGLNLVIILVNYALAQGAMTWLDHKWTAEDVVPVAVGVTRRWLVGTGVVLVAWTGLSLVTLNSTPSMPKVRVATVRPNFPLPAHQDEVNTSQARFDAFAEQAREAAAQGAQIIYSPEMMFNFDPQVEYTEQFRALARETGAYLFITYTVGIEGQSWRNESVMLSPEGEFSQVYGKNHTWLIGEPDTPSAGVFPVYDTPLGRLAGMICHDANYTDIARKLAANGAQIVAAPYREFAGFGEQAWTNVLFRAVENRTAMVISGVASVSGIINPNGSLVALDTNIGGSRVTLVGDVSLGSGPTPYTSLGDILGWISLAGFVSFMIFQSMTERRAQKSASSKFLS